MRKSGLSFGFLCLAKVFGRLDIPALVHWLLSLVKGSFPNCQGKIEIGLKEVTCRLNLKMITLFTIRLMISSALVLG